MALRVPIKWLNEYVASSLAPAELAERLTLAGLEVESITAVGAEWHPEQVVVGKIVEVAPHPNADRLCLVTVEYGAEGPLTEVLEKLEEYKERAAKVQVTGNRDFNPGWHNAMDLRAMLTTSEASARAALARRESRGAQFREDHPQKDAALGKVMHVIRKGADGQMHMEAETLPAIPPDLQQIIEDNK